MERLSKEPRTAETDPKTLKLLRDAYDYAQKVMADVPEDYPGRGDLWMVHFYGFFYTQAFNPNQQLIETIEHFTMRAEHALQLAE